jgi:Pregnancy-associated plasma protein-A
MWGSYVQDDGSDMKRSVLGGLASLTLLGGVLAPTVSASLASEPSDAVIAKAAGKHCGGHPANARVMKGTSKWREPNTLTRPEAVAMEARNQRILDRHGIRPASRANGSVKIKVHFHVIMDKGGHGFVSKKRINRQIKVLNRAFGGRTGPAAVDTPFRFRLESTERVTKTKWYNANYFTKVGRKRLRDMRRELRVGDARDLNIYTVGPKFQLLGLATFPGSYRKFPRLDGSVVFNESLPGGNADFGENAVYNKGDTATHEVGHWLNLYHTFQGGCGRLNDFVTDTPRQAAGDDIFICDPSLNTCPPFGSNSPDPVHNFMNYTDDPCMNQFTRGQRERMNTGWYIRRALSS